MKWNIAVKKIKQLINEGDIKIQVIYHKKYAKNLEEYGKSGIVESISDYFWNGEVHESINIYNAGLPCNCLLESIYVIDDIQCGIH